MMLKSFERFATAVGAAIVAVLVAALLNDDTCGQNTAKIGADNDVKTGGCDNSRITIGNNNQVQAAYWTKSD